MPPKLPYRRHRLTRFTHTKQRKAKISDALKWNWGIKLFVAHADIRISEDWSAEIKDALSSCDAGIAFLTDREAFKASTWCDQEIGWMLGRSEDKVLAMRFKLNGVYQDPYGPLGGCQAQPVAENESEDQITAKIVDWCMTRESLQNKLCTSLVKAFAKARNWYQRDDIYQRLKLFIHSMSYKFSFCWKACITTSKLGAEKIEQLQSIPKCLIHCLDSLLHSLVSKANLPGGTVPTQTVLFVPLK